VGNVRSYSVVAALVAVMVAGLGLSSISVSFAASADRRADRRANVTYASGAASHSSRADAVPANCVRQECGKLWCWEMRGKTSSH
jgi:hypothetical protein